jgi:maltose/moltooligosaccharide transporter
LGFGWLMREVLHNDRLLAVQLGGGLMVIAAVICYVFIREPRKIDQVLADKLAIEGRDQ